MKNVFDSEGDLREVDPLAALVSCWREKSSGALRFTRGPTECGFDLSEGDVVGIVSSDPRFETAAILVRANKLAPDAVERLSGEGGDAAALALQSGLLTRREWKWGEKIRAIEVFSDLLTWNGGGYRLEPNVPAPAGDFRLPVPRLLLELFLRSRDRNLIDHQLGPADQSLVRAERFDEEFPTFGLTADAESVVRLIDGRSTAAQIAEKAPADEFAVRKLLAALVTLGLVHPVPAAPARSPERLRAPEAPPPPAAPEPAWPEEAEEPARIEPSFPEEAFPGTSAETAEEEPFEATLPEFPEPAAESATIELPDAEPSPLDDFSPSAPDPRWTPRHEEGARPEPGLFDAAPELSVAPPAETLEDAPPARSGGALPWALGVLVVAVVGVVLWRMREHAPTAGPSPRPTSAPAVTFPPPATAVAAAPVRPTAAAPAAVASTTAPRAATTAPAPAGGARAASAAANVGAPASSASIASSASTKGAEPDSRDAWARRAERDRRKLESDRRTRYAVQLELVCEVPSLTDAWHYDRGGAMWLLPTRHGDRDCYRVLWGRYASLDAARRGKTGIPAYFTTARNKPAVIAVK